MKAKKINDILLGLQECGKKNGPICDDCPYRKYEPAECYQKLCKDAFNDIYNRYFINDSTNKNGGNENEEQVD